MAVLAIIGGDRRSPLQITGISRYFFDKQTFHLSDGRFLHIGIKNAPEGALVSSILRGVFRGTI